LHWLPEKRAKSSKEHPDYAECCCAGEVCLKFVDPIPPELTCLFEGEDSQATKFHRNICLYNKALAFTSTGGSRELVSTSYDGRGPPLYKIQGEIHHQIGSILPNEGKHPVYSQRYIYDHDEALQYCLHKNRKRDQHTMHILQEILEQYHPSVDVYQQAYQLTQTTELTEYCIQLNFQKGSDHRRYNLPTTDNELALIIPGDEDACANSQDIIL